MPAVLGERSACGHHPMLWLKIKSRFVWSFGVQADTVQRLADMLNHDMLPSCIPRVLLGASGDLAPLSHFMPSAYRGGRVIYLEHACPPNRLCQMAGWEPLHLKSKKGWH